MHVDELHTPALIVDVNALDRNANRMSDAHPGSRLRPHVKAFKSTSLAKRLRDNGHHGFTCATIREMEAMAHAGLGDDLLLANEVLDARRLGRLTVQGHRITVAVDSTQTIDAALAGGVPEVLIDVNVRMPRCGCQPGQAGRLADHARSRGLTVRGVMGYEGHLMMVQPEPDRRTQTEHAMKQLTAASEAVGGDIISGGGTGTYAVNTWVNEIQAGSYTLMDTEYSKLGLPFEQAAYVVGTVISVSKDWAVIDVGLKALSVDHGLPAIDGYDVWFCSDEHTTIRAAEYALPRLGDRLWVKPSHIDPTVALHDRMSMVEGTTVVDEWPIDMKGWR